MERVRIEILYLAVSLKVAEQKDIELPLSTKQVLEVSLIFTPKLRKPKQVSVHTHAHLTIAHLHQRSTEQRSQTRCTEGQIGTVTDLLLEAYKVTDTGSRSLK